ncbi:MAG: hypothetical protein ABR540_04075 [Acidimicrobiales bacterium]
MNSYAMAFGILGSGVVIAALLWSVPLLRRRTQVRRFRQSLDHVDAVVMGWTQAVREGQPFDGFPDSFPSPRRRRRLSEDR